MGKIRIINLIPHQRKELEDGYRNGPTHAFRKRCQLVLLKSQKRSAKQVSHILDCAQLTVNNWLTRYDREGVDGLKTKPGRGGKSKLVIEIDADLVKDTVKKHRQEVQKDNTEIETHIGQPLSQQTLRRFLKMVADTSDFANE